MAIGRPSTCEDFVGYCPVGTTKAATCGNARSDCTVVEIPVPIIAHARGARIDLQKCDPWSQWPGQTTTRSQR
jgi:hypothetical protein